MPQENLDHVAHCTKSVLHSLNSNSLCLVSAEIVYVAAVSFYPAIDLLSEKNRELDPRFTIDLTSKRVYNSHIHEPMDGMHRVQLG
jgi:hypothetical protein